MKAVKWLVLVSTLVLGLGSLQAGSGKSRVLKEQKRKVMLSNLTKGTVFESGKRKFVILPDLVLEPIQQSRRRVKNKVQEDAIGFLGQRKIVKNIDTQSSSTSNTQTHMLSSNNITPPHTTDNHSVNWRGAIVLNQRTGGFGLMTGNIIVQYRAGTDVSTLSQKTGLKNFKDFPHLEIVFFIIPEGTDIFQAAADLKLQDGVTMVETEVIEHFATPR